MNSDGQIFSLDLLLYVILLSLILSIIYFVYVDVDSYSREAFSDSYVELKLNDFSDMLIYSEGTPSNWEFLQYDDINSIGFKSSNSSFLSFGKINRLRRDNSLIYSYLPEGMYCSISYYPSSNPSNKTFIVSDDFSDSYGNVKVSSHLFFMDWGYDILAVDGDVLFSCPYHHDSDEFYCKSFSLSMDKLTNGRYYLISNGSVSYILSNTYDVNRSGSFNNLEDISDDVEYLLSNDTGSNMTLFLHTNSTCFVVYDAGNNRENLMNVLDDKAFILEIKFYY